MSEDYESLSLILNRAVFVEAAVLQFALSGPAEGHGFDKQENFSKGP